MSDVRPVYPSRQPPSLFSEAEIAEAFTLLGLESEQAREQFRSLAVESSDAKGKRYVFWLTSTTDQERPTKDQSHA